MKAVLFYISLGIIGIIKLLPIRILYIISDFIYFAIYYIVCYRKNTVYTNLRESFPAKTETEIKAIAKKFYRHLADVFIEYVILSKLNSKALEKRLKFRNPETVTDLLDDKRNVILVTAHYGNWELASVIGTISKSNEVVAVYKRLHNKYWDKWFIKLRSKCGAKLIEMREVFRHLVQNKTAGVNAAISLIADQLPRVREAKHTVNFLNHEGTFVFLGADRLAKSFNAAVLYANIQKVKRGYYEIEFITLTTEPKSQAEYEITDMHVKMLEKIITEKPEYWLWTHKRWKRTAKNEQTKQS